MSADLIEKLLAKMKKTGSSDMLPPKMEPGEAPSSGECSHPSQPLVYSPIKVITDPFTDAPPFPSYSIQPEHPIMTSAPRYPFVRPFAGGPIPAPGTPQDRFAAVLGRPRYSSLPAPLLGMALNTTTPFPPPSHQQSSAFGMHLAAPGVSTPGALPAPQPIPSLAAPAAHKPQVGPTGRSSNNGGGRGPTLPEPAAPVTTW